MSMASPPVARLGGALDAVAVGGGAAQVGKRVGQTVGGAARDARAVRHHARLRGLLMITCTEWPRTRAACVKRHAINISYTYSGL
jgi:hypothetical protein